MTLHDVKGVYAVFMKRDESRTKRKNRERILEAARGLFLEKGLHGTTMLEIAEKADVERRTLYNYYESMDLLAMELQVGYLAELQEAWIEVDGDLSGFEQARSLLTAFCDFCISRPDLIKFTVQFDHYFNQSYENADYENFMKNYLKQSKALEKALKKGLGDGSIFVDPHKVDKIAVTIIQSVMGLAQRIIFREPIYKMEYGYTKDDMRYMVDILLFGLKG